MKQLKHIAILMGQDLSFCRNVTHGIYFYAAQRNTWVIRYGIPRMEIIPYIREWEPEGIIANLSNNDIAQAIMELRKPIVDTAYVIKELEIPTVDVDHVAVGQLAAEHLIQNRSVNFGFFGSKNSNYSIIREKSFRDELAKDSHTVSSCHVEYLHHVPDMIYWNHTDQAVIRWLKTLLKPVAIFAANDVLARYLAELCRYLDLHIPDDVSLLSADNDDLECHLKYPPLSSIAIPAQRIGYEAARTLDRLISGEQLSEKRLFLPPLHVIDRQSTSKLMVDDTEVREAVKYIRNNFKNHFTIAKLVKEIGCSRRDLERRFRQIMKRSILNEIQLVRVGHAKDLLLNTNMSMPNIAANSGFSNADRLAVVFRELTGMSPTQYRHQSQIPNA